MTLEFIQDGKKKEELISCEELLARVPEIPHLGTYIQKEPHATDLSQVKPIRKDKEIAVEEEEKKNPV